MGRNKQLDSHHLDHMKEDYDFMREGGASHEEAARRLGLTVKELDSHLSSLDRRGTR